MWQYVTKEAKAFAEEISIIVRGSQGLPIEDSSHGILIDANDSRERTRLSGPNDEMARIYMRTVSRKYPELFGIYDTIVEHIDHYAISRNDGEGRREHILDRRSEVVMPGQPNVQLPMIQTQQQLTEQPTGKEQKVKAK